MECQLHSLCLADGHAGFETAAFVSKNLHTYVRDAIESETTLPMMSKKKNSSSPHFLSHKVQVRDLKMMKILRSRSEIERFVKLHWNDL